MSTSESQSLSQEEIASPTRLGNSSPILSYFCVYNPSLGQSEENTKDQILYYTAKKAVPADVKMKQIGLAQALVNFTSTFSTGHSSQNVHSQKNRMVFLQPEPNFWMHMCIELGVLRKQIKGSKGKEKLVTEYLDSQLNDRALEAVLKIGYEQFKLLNGTFHSVLYGNTSEPPNRQRTRVLMHMIEEFFSEWIWKWDFDRLDIMCFNAVFNGVPVQPVLRSSYLQIHALEKSIKERFEDHVSHMFALNLNDGALVYRSPDLDIHDVCALRKHTLKRVEKHIKAEKRKQMDLELLQPTHPYSIKLPGLKQFTKSISQSHILSYFSAGGSKSTDTFTSTSSHNRPASIESVQALPNTHDIPTAPSSPNGSIVESEGIYLTGLVESTAIGMNGEERPVTKSELVRVYLQSGYHGDEQQKDTLTEYYLLIYKHKSNLVWNFLLPATSTSEDILSDPMFYADLEQYLLQEKLEELTQAILANISDVQEKSLNLGMNYKCFYYDNTTLNIKSTMVDPRSSSPNPKERKAAVQVTHDMLLQMLDVRDDFEKLPRTNEVYTRSTANHWVAGNRLYNALKSPSLDINDDRTDEPNEDYTEIYLIAAKKDTSLAEVEDTLKKMSATLIETMHIEQ
ncbi:hypothetical protein EDC96DRAFT_519288 [Choanephora cucurbitarum]|nr:hypothetical protein EDC96DRAFT_519288 [Choanephora cucurbitarum]